MIQIFIDYNEKLNSLAHPLMDAHWILIDSNTQINGNWWEQIGMLNRFLRLNFHLKSLAHQHMENSRKLKIYVIL